MARNHTARGGDAKIATRNEGWGFFGTLAVNGVGDDQAKTMFDEAARELMARFRLTADEASDVLDARIGRHTANDHRRGETGRELMARLCTDRACVRWIHRVVAQTKAARS